MCLGFRISRGFDGFSGIGLEDVLAEILVIRIQGLGC